MSPDKQSLPRPTIRSSIHERGSLGPPPPSASPGERVERAARTLRHALTLDDPDMWADVGTVWRARLTLRDRVGFAFSALRSSPEDERRAVAEHAVGGAGRPLPPFLDLEADAARWANLANLAERRAYAAAALERMSPRERWTFDCKASETPRSARTRGSLPRDLDADDMPLAEEVRTARPRGRTRSRPAAKP